VPVLPTKLKAVHGVLVTVGSLTCVLVLTMAIFLLLLRHYVVSPLETITRTTRSTSLGADAGDVGAATWIGGQFHDLEQSIHRLKVSLEEALRMFNSLAGGDRKK
jgi:hypothetical protein